VFWTASDLNDKRIANPALNCMKMKTNLCFPLFLSVLSSAVIALALQPRLASAQPYDITTFDPTLAGSWSDLGTTTLMVPKVTNGSVKLDGAVSDLEYGGFKGVTVTPGDPAAGGNAWILNFPGDRVWDGTNDSSFTYWLAHDDDYFYIGVNANDDVVNSDDPNDTFWQDDAIEIQVDALHTQFDSPSSGTPVGGHSYVNYQGRFSAWDDTTGKTNSFIWAPAVNWKYGETNDVFGFGKAVAGGWQMEVRFKKRMFEDATAGNKLKNGYLMGFNIGMDDDDKHGKGTNGDQTRAEDLEVQYWWADRQRYTGYNADYLATLTPEEKAAQIWRADTDNHPLALDPSGHAQGGNGEIIFGYDADLKSTGKILFVCANAVSPVSADAGLIALLRAKGYTVTVFASGGPPDDLRAAAVGQDVALLSESIGSATVLEPIGDPVLQKFILRDTDIPIISYEAFMWDNAEWTTHPEDYSNEFSMFGNTGRTEDTQAPEIKDGRDSLYIRLPAHPIANGLTGKVKVYNTLYSLNYATPSADADVVASVEADGKYPTLFVYEKGDKLVDGSVVPNKRIGLYLGQVAALVANWNPELGFLNEDGKTLLFNTLDYAIGKNTQPPPVTPTLSIARSGNDLVVTYANGTLQSVGALPATTAAWKNETGPSPLTIKSPTTTQFFRVQGQ
ncbi:MAG: sugar-binding protein, partial [Verrucomicrobiota bacterium]